jgi:hypothetical protein
MLAATRGKAVPAGRSVQSLGPKESLMRLLVLLALFVSTPAFAGQLNTPDETKALCSAVAAKMGAGDSDAAFDLLSPNWPLPPEELKQLAYQTKSKLEMVGSRFGAPLGSEFVRSEAAATSFVRHHYLVKFEKHALRLSCTFYKPKDSWIVNTVTWDDSPDQLLR